jgi:hypothetical protein
MKYLKSRNMARALDKLNELFLSFSTSSHYEKANFFLVSISIQAVNRIQPIRPRNTPRLPRSLHLPLSCITNDSSLWPCLDVRVQRLPWAGVARARAGSARRNVSGIGVGLLVSCISFGTSKAVKARLPG